VVTEAFRIFQLLVAGEPEHGAREVSTNSNACETHE
jgi:hypothetical protein